MDEAGEPHVSGLRMIYEEEMNDIPTSELWKLHLQRNEICKRYLDEWNRTAEKTKSGRPIDAIIRSPISSLSSLPASYANCSPVSPYPAVLHGNMEGVSYSSVWNLLGMSFGGVD
jgi:hypothetical protein